MSAKAAKKSSQPSHLKDLIMLFAIPIGIAMLAAIFTYAPRLFANPKYDFIYSLCSDYYCRDSYSVNSLGHVDKYYQNSSIKDNYNGTEAIRYYDSASDSTKSISIVEARQYRLNTSSKSPDGYSLIKEESDSGFLFWSNNDSGWYLKNGAKKKKVELSTNGSYYSRDVKLLGWVEK